METTKNIALNEIIVEFNPTKINIYKWEKISCVLNIDEGTEDDLLEIDLKTLSYFENVKEGEIVFENFELDICSKGMLQGFYDSDDFYYSDTNDMEDKDEHLKSLNGFKDYKNKISKMVNDFIFNGEKHISDCYLLFSRIEDKSGNEIYPSELVKYVYENK